MTSMIEKVARGLHHCIHSEPPPMGPNNPVMWSELGGVNSEFYLRAARIALEAMLEPTDDMILAGARAGVDQIYYKNNAWERCVAQDEQRRDYLNFAKYSHCAIIDAALKEKP